MSSSSPTSPAEPSPQPLRRANSKYASGVAKVKRAVKIAAEQQHQQHQGRADGADAAAGSPGVMRMSSSRALDEDLRGSFSRLTGQFNSPLGRKSSSRRVDRLVSSVQEAAKDRFLQHALLQDGGDVDDLDDGVTSGGESFADMMLKEISVAAFLAVEQKRRTVLIYRGFVRPQLWFAARVLPLYRMRDLQLEALGKKVEYLFDSEPIYRDLMSLDERYGRLTILLDHEETTQRQRLGAEWSALVTSVHADVFVAHFGDLVSALFDATARELSEVALSASGLGRLQLAEERARRSIALVDEALERVALRHALTRPLVTVDEPLERAAIAARCAVETRRAQRLEAIHADSRNQQRLLAEFRGADFLKRLHGQLSGRGPPPHQSPADGLVDPEPTPRSVARAYRAYCEHVYATAPLAAMVAALDASKIDGDGVLRLRGLYIADRHWLALLHALAMCGAAGVRLREVDLSSTQMTDERLQQFCLVARAAPLSELTSLRLDGNPLVSVVGMRALLQTVKGSPALPQLEHVSAQGVMMLATQRAAFGTLLAS